MRSFIAFMAVSVLLSGCGSSQTGNAVEGGNSTNTTNTTTAANVTEAVSIPSSGEGAKIVAPAIADATAA